MRHLKATRKLGLDTAHRVSMLRNMVDSLIVSGRIKTTVTRAKELRRIADKMITYSKKNTLHSKRMALKILRTKDAFTKLFSDEYRELFSARKGGYTRIVKIGDRLGDNAPMAYIEYVTEKEEAKKKTGRKRRRKSKSANKETVSVATKEAKETTKPETEKTVDKKVDEKIEVKNVETKSKEDLSTEDIDNKSNEKVDKETKKEEVKETEEK